MNKVAAIDQDQCEANDDYVTDSSNAQEDWESSTYNRWMDTIGRVVTHLALIFGLMTIIAQIWIKFH